MLVRLSSCEASSCGQDNHREINTRDTRFYPMVRPSNTCLLPRCGVPMDEGCTQPLSSDPMINLNTMLFFFLRLSPVCEESPQLGASHPYNWWSQRSTEVREGRATHKTQYESTITHISHNSSSKHNSRSSQLKWSSSHYLKESNAWEWSLGVLGSFL
jgi:hypothetical protein